MSLAAACVWTLIRTLVLCAIAWPICLRLEAWIRNVEDRWRPLSLTMLLAPALFPELVVGYAFRNTALTSPVLAEWLCAGLLFIRLVPIGVVTLLASPLSLADSSAIHCRGLALNSSSRSIGNLVQLGLCYWHGPIRRVLPALGLMSIVAFQEFELAALLQAASWTDWFIAAERFGLSRSEMLRQSLWPVLIQAPLVVGVIAWTVRPHDAEVESSESTILRRGTRAIVGLYLMLAIIAGCAFPVAYLGTNLATGLQMVFRQPVQLIGILREIAITAAVSSCACLTAWSISPAFFRSLQSHRTGARVRHIVLMIGLAGSLLLSLAVCALFQQPWLRIVYDTPLPWLLALIVWLIPRAVLVRLWLDTVIRSEAIHLAELLSGPMTNQARPPTEAGHQIQPDILTTARGTVRQSALLFRLRDQPRLLALALLFYWAYLDLSTAYLLAPSGMPSGLVRLYNFMHFGRSSALSAEAALFFGTPVLVMLSGLMIRRLIKRRQ